MNDERTKPARELKPGEIVAARIGLMTRTLRFVSAPRSRVAAKLVPQFAEELTPPEEFAKRHEPNLLPPGFRPKGAGRPTKRERRTLDGGGELQVVQQNLELSASDVGEMQGKRVRLSWDPGVELTIKEAL